MELCYYICEILHEAFVTPTSFGEQSNSQERTHVSAKHVEYPTLQDKHPDITSCNYTPPLENLKPAFASLWTKDYKIKPQKLKNPSKIKSAKFCNEQLAKKMMLSAKKNSHTRLNQAAKKSSYHKTPSIDVGLAQPARRTKISKTGLSVKQKTRIPTSTQPHATPFTMSKAPVPPPTSSQCAANVVTQEQQHPAIMSPPSVSQTDDIGVPKSSTEYHH